MFRKDGTVHAGNSSGITDGAAAVLVMDAAGARELGVVKRWTASDGTGHDEYLEHCQPPVLCWRDDRCEDAANVLEGVALKNA